MEKETKMVDVEIDLDEFTVQQLQFMIIRSDELNMTFSEFVVHCLTEYVKNNPLPEEK